MVIDQDYLKAVFNVFLDAPTSFVYVSNFVGGDILIDDRFLFHMQILEDQNMVEPQRKGMGMGYEIGMGGEFTWSNVPLRLTSRGHELATALNRSEIFDILKGEFSDASIETLSELGKSLLMGFAKKQLAKYVEL